MKNEFAKILNNYADPVSLKILEHSPEKCGQCAKEWITHQVAKDFINQNKTGDDFLSEFYKEVDRQWHEHPIYKKIKEYESQGLSLPEALDKAFKDDGIIG